MSKISAAVVKELREKTYAGMMDCKKALEACDGDIEVASDWLRKKGLAAAGKKASRVASEGVVVIANTGKKAVILELNAETDFVSKNDKFQSLAHSLAQLALEQNATSVDSFLTLPTSSGRSVQEEIVEHIATIGENIKLRRLEYTEITHGRISSYVHGAVAADMGKIGVIIALESQSDNEALQIAGKNLAMHIAATHPEVLHRDQLAPERILKEKEILAEQIRASNKPEALFEKMIEGKLNKFCEEIVLMEQVYALDGKTKIAQILSELSKNVGTDVKIKSFSKYVLGDGIEKESSDFAAEVAAMAK